MPTIEDLITIVSFALPGESNKKTGARLAAVRDAQQVLANARRYEKFDPLRYSGLREFDGHQKSNERVAWAAKRVLPFIED